MKRLLFAIALLFVSSAALAAININTATKEELEALPGIGPVKAQAIIDYRNANGSFKSTQDIMKVRGIKEGEFGKIRDQIAVAGATTLPPASSTKPGAMAPAAPSKTAPPASAAPAAPPPAASAPAKDSGSMKMSAAEEKAAKAKEEKAAKAKAKEEKAAKAKEEKAAMAKAKEEKAAKAKEEKAAKAKEKQDKAAKAKEDKMAKATKKEEPAKDSAKAAAKDEKAKQ
jgi:competence protein ComEA